MGTGEAPSDASSFDWLIDSVITILTDYIPSHSKASSADVNDDFVKQGKELFADVEERFKAINNRRATRVFENFLDDPEEYGDNLHKQLAHLFHDEPDFARELCEIVARPLFLPRTQELDHYMKFLDRETPWIWIVTALERSGKTELLQQMRNTTPTNIPIVQLDFAREPGQSDSLTGERVLIDGLYYLRSFATQVKGACDPNLYSKFQKELTKTYKDANNKIINQFIQAPQNAASSEAPTHLRLLQRDHRQQAWEHMTPLFHDLLDTFWPNRLVIQLDSCEWLMDPINLPARYWLVKDVLLPLHDSLRQKRKQCHIVMMSNVMLDLPFRDNRDRQHISLPPLDEKSVQHYLQRIGIDDPALRQLLYNMTGGHASCVSLLCELWHEWKEDGKHISTRETLIEFQKAFYEKAAVEFRQHVLDKFPNPGSMASRISPLYALTKYGSLLREFDLSQLISIFGNIEVPESEVEAVFNQLIHRCYIILSEKGDKYAVHELFRTVLGQYLRGRERKNWGTYHGRYMKFFHEQTDPLRLPASTDWHYHNLGYHLGQDENEASAIHYWKDTLALLLRQGQATTPLEEAACDKTLMFTSVAYEAQQYQQETRNRKERMA